MMKTSIFIKRIFSLAIGIFLVGVSFSQRDSIPKKGTIDITSSFKPILKEPAKINFNASPALNDTTKPKLNYEIPTQNLLFPYSPGNLKPLALDIDSAGVWDMSSFIKAGFGSLKTPFLQAGISFGDGKTAGLNIFANHISSEGKIENQQYRNTGVDLKGFLQTNNNMEWNARLGMKQDRYYKYGIDPSISTVPPKDSLEQSFQTWNGGLSVRNINQTQFGISYSPEVFINVFNDGRENSESNTYLNIPIRKSVGKVVAVDLSATFDLTKYKPGKTSSIDNTFYYISPSVLFKTPKVNLQGGLRPSWDNKTFKLFPNILGEVSSEDKRFVFEAGWTGYIRRTSYQYLASINPYLAAPTELNNTWIEERFAGIKGSVGDHFSYNTKLGFNKIKNQPLFVNNEAGFYDETFRVVYEEQMKEFFFGSELTYNEQEKFSVTGGIAYHQYMNLHTNDKAYGLIPLELKGSLRLQILKDLWLKSDAYLWKGPWYKNSEGGSDELGSAIDLNAGVEYRIAKQINLWAQFNNIFNQQYERWKLYPSYGFNFVAGVIFAFDQKTK